MGTQRKAGIIQVQTGGVIQDAKGNFSYNLGNEKRDAIMGADGVHGYAAKPQVAFVEGEITDRGDLDLNALTLGEDITVTLALANGKTIMLNNAWFAAEGTGNSEEGNIQVRWESKNKGQEVT